MHDDDDEDDSDLDEVAYMSSDDDASGPGWLVGLSIVFTTIGFTLTLLVTILGMIYGLFDAGAAAAPLGGFWTFFSFIFLAFALGSSGFGAGMAAFAIAKAKSLGRDSIVGVAKILLVVSVVLAIVPFGIGLYLSIAVILR